MHISGLELDLMANAAYVLILISFLMRDILWLRTFSLLATFIVVPYYLLQTQPLWPCIAWNIALAVINSYWIVRLSLERRPVHFTQEEQRLYDKALRAMLPRDARRLFQAGTSKSVASGETIVTQGQPLNQLFLITGGDFTVEMDGMVVDEIGEGRFIGSYSFLKGVKNFPAPVFFKATKPSRLIVWQNEDLRSLIGDDSKLSMAVEASLGLELAQFLDHSRNDVKLERRLLNQLRPHLQTA